MTKATSLFTGLLAVIGAYSVSTGAADDEGVAIAIVYDISGGMRDQVRDETGRLSPKYVIGNRALENVAARMQAFASQSASGSSRNIQAGLFVFDHDRVKEAVKFGPFVADVFKRWAQKFSWPEGATPLGSALEKAGDVVMGSNLSRKHVLVITDGVNTRGPTPATLGDSIRNYIREQLGNRPLTGSDVEAILTRAKERAVLAKRDDDVQLADLQEAVDSFIDPPDPDLLALQELAAVLACSDRRYLPERYRLADRASLGEEFAQLKMRLRLR